MGINGITSNNSMINSGNEIEKNVKQSPVQENGKSQETDGTSKQVNTSEANYAAKNNDGDTLELSSIRNRTVEDNSKIVIEEENNNASGAKQTDASLAKCSKGRLQQLLASGQITRKQYEKALKKQKES